MFDRDFVKKIQKEGMSLRIASEAAFKADRDLAALRLQKNTRWGADVTVIGDRKFDDLCDEITRLERNFPAKFRDMMAAAIKAGEITATGLKVPTTHDRERGEITSDWFEDQAARVILRRSEIRRMEDRKLVLKFEDVRLEPPDGVKRSRGSLKQEVLAALDELRRSGPTNMSKNEEARLVATRINYDGDSDNIRRMISLYSGTQIRKPK